MHEGVPVGGALVPELLARANVAVDNAWDETAIEVLGSIAIAATGPLVVGSDAGDTRVLGDGETWSVDCQGARVRYLAVRGGIDVPRVLGGRGTLLSARLGGHEGRPLRRGDVLTAGSAPPVSTQAPVAPDALAPFRLVPGPDLDRVAPDVLERLVASRFTIDPRSDRVGVRLAGAPLGRPTADAGVSAPMVRGAIQLPPDGVPIVLGPDHPTTGGYPVIGTVVSADQGRLAALGVGARVRLVTVGGPISAPATPGR
jgi:allophanate hydrolase subunit 2